MWRAHRAKLTVVIATGALVGFTFASRALLKQQAAIARNRIGHPLGDTSPNADRVWRRKYGGRPIRLLILGDSLAAGLGAELRKDTLGGRLARRLGAELLRPVLLRTGAVVGAETSDLMAQLDELPPDYRADVAVIIVGGNDVTHLVPVAESARQLQEAIRRLHDLGTRVVVGTCPDLGAIRPVPQPLRALLSRRSQYLAQVQRRVVQRARATAVSLRKTVGPMFRAEPETMFSIDQFHPSAAGYKRTVEALLPAVTDALSHRMVAETGQGRPMPR